MSGADFSIRGDTSLDSNGFSAGLNKIASISTKVFAGLVTGASAAIGAIGGIGMAYNATMEKYQTNLTTMLNGNAEAAQKLTDEIKNMASSTPLAMNDLMDAAQTLMTFGAADENNMVKTLQMIGDVAMGDSQKMQSLSLAYGQMVSTGKLQGQDLLQMINAGFNPLVELSKMGYGTVEQLKEQMSEGAISVEMVTKAFEHATQEGGQFYNALNNQGETFNGQISTIKDKVSELGGALTSGVFQSVSTTLLPTVIEKIEELKNALDSGGITGFINATGDVLAEALTMLAESAPKFIQTAVDLLKAFTNGIVSSLPKLIPAAGKIVKTLASGIMQMGPVLFSAMDSITNMLITGIKSILPTLSENIASFLKNALPQMLSFTENLREKVGELVDIGLQLVQNLWNGIVQALPALIENVPQIVTNIASIINDNFPKILATAVSMIWELIKGLISSIPNIIAAIPQIIEAIVSVFMAFNWISLGNNIIELLKNGISAMKGAIGEAAKGIFETVKNIIANLPATLQNIGSSAISFMSNGINSMLSAIISAAKSILTGIVNTVVSLPSKLFTIAKNAISRMWTAFTSTDWGSIGTNIIKGITGGIAGAVGGLIDAAVNAAKSAFDAAKNFLGIHSPSRLFRDRIGKMIPQGMAIGIEADTKKVEDAMKVMNQKGLQAIEQNQRFIPKFPTAFGGSDKDDDDVKEYVNNVQNIYFQKPVETPDEIARTLRIEQTYGLAGDY